MYWLRLFIAAYEHFIELYNILKMIGLVLGPSWMLYLQVLSCSLCAILYCMATEHAVVYM